MLFNYSSKITITTVFRDFSAITLLERFTLILTLRVF